MLDPMLHEELSEWSLVAKAPVVFMKLDKYD